MATIVEQDSSLTIYRFKFSDPFMDLLRNFANNHRFDEASVFKERWMRWSCNETNIAEILKEEKRLVDSGYKGDMEDKMFKTVRYYLKNKSVEKKEPKKRRKYISISKNIIETMDEHIEETAMNENMKPAVAYNNYSSHSVYSEMIDEEVDRLIKLDMNEVSAINKIKKTYKNRYYLQQKN
jgi:hypothetical protein